MYGSVLMLLPIVCLRKINVIIIIIIITTFSLLVTETWERIYNLHVATFYLSDLDKISELFLVFLPLKKVANNMMQKTVSSAWVAVKRGTSGKCLRGNRRSHKREDVALHCVGLHSFAYLHLLPLSSS